MTNPPITVPIALSCGTTADLTTPWFVQKAEYRAAPATFQPLVNGEEAFGAVYDAIVAAKKTVDIICWGFQPSMYFKRGQDRGMPIGQLLAQKGAEGIQVRLLCWQDNLHGTQWMENMAPGTNLKTVKESGLYRLSEMARSLGLNRAADWMRGHITEPEQQFQREFDQEWYGRALRSNVTEGRPTWPHPEAFPHFEFATRDFYLDSRIEITYRTWLHGEDSTRSTATKAASGALMGLTFPTHHQKMVLIDYEDPGRAVGFVMGHNTLDEYWDTNEHSSVRMHPAMGRNGRHPRQDISSRVTGPILKYLNANFCQAWDRATRQNLTAARAAICYPQTLRVDEGTPVMAQILRTQSQEGKDAAGHKGTRDIKTMYLQAVNNATQFIYIENQYFRWNPLVDQLQQAVRKQLEWGRVTGGHGAVHLFVVTNASDDGIGNGTVNTYRMLDALGRADTIPAIAKAERNDALKQERRALESRIREEKAIQASPGVGTADPYGYSLSTSQRQTLLAQSRDHQQSTQQQIDKLDQQITKNNDETVPSRDIDGLKVHVCSLVAPDTPPGQPWEYTYVHAKLMIVDDVFTTLGSANLNTRSMEADSELNICHEHSGVTQPLRRRLWEMHTGGKKNGASDKPADAFDAWADIIEKNKNNQKARLAPYAPLIEFQYTGTKRSILD